MEREARIKIRFRSTMFLTHLGEERFKFLKVEIGLSENGRFELGDHFSQRTRACSVVARDIGKYSESVIGTSVLL